MLELDSIKSELANEQKNLNELGESLDVAKLTLDLEEIDFKVQIDGFWDHLEEAQKTLKEKKRLETKLGEFNGLKTQLEDVEVLIQMSEEAEDASVVEEIQEIYRDYKEKVEELRLKTLLSGPYDSSNAIISIHAGSGGLDAQDWAEMLHRMYIRWAEKKDYRIQTLDYQGADEGGIKSATLRIEGENAYGYLKNEKGVHRIVRISPFDSSGRRHTSFASLDVTPELDDNVAVEINPDDIRVDTYRSSGAGGQHVNKTDSAIRITHIPTNIVVTCQNERSQHQNREVAMRVLKGKLYELALQEHKDKIDELKGDFSQITWGSQIRSYVFHPYNMVKDHRTGAEVSNVYGVMDGDLDYFINEKLKQKETTDS
ncbi:peptide chain release factor 2 [Anaerovorax sp. IOR16]|uniref:peptide chain release factor 2 n=1 Tax=Anaerovorax sp. IOR16 TaxID=2773458 RepID=UPI0019D2065E|nr:peptide chain release factor 2 [Anaerovorax sp. IOR16]